HGLQSRAVHSPYCRITCLVENCPVRVLLYSLSLHDALPICRYERGRRSADRDACRVRACVAGRAAPSVGMDDRAPDTSAWQLARSEEHTSELQSLRHLVYRLLPEKKNPDPLA